MGKFAWLGYSPEAWERSRYSKATNLKQEKWVENQLSSGSKGWDQVTGSMDGDVARRKDWGRQKSD
jgi:hypothetical protein